MDTMDEEALRRLNAVQLEDLGTARREYISTVDTNKKFRNVTIEAIEAAREANKKGSAVHRLAQKNKDSLNAWNTAWQTMCEEVDLEDLDPLMGGQTHRAHLSAFVKENGGQNYGKNPVLVMPTTKIHKQAGISGRGAVASTRGRRGSRAKPTLHSPHGRPLDPARDCNNKGSPPRGISKKRGDMLGGMRRPPKPPTLRTRRVVGPSVAATYNNLLADSSEFMSAISNLIPPKPSIFSIAGAGQTQNHGSVKNTTSALKQEVVKEAVEPKADEHKSVAGRVITPPVTNFTLHESPASDGGTPVLRTGKLKGIGSALPAVNRQSCGVKKEQEISLLDSSVDPLSSDSATLDFSASSKPDPKSEELEDLIKLLANSSLMPPEAVSYLEGRKQALERELGKATSKPQFPCQPRAMVKHEPKVEIKREHADELTVKTKAEANFELVAKRARMVFAQAEISLISQPKSALSRPAETSKNPINATEPARTPIPPKFETTSISDLPKPTIEAKPTFKLPGQASTSATPVREAKFSIKTHEPVASKNVSLIDTNDSIIGDHLLPGRKSPLLSGVQRNPLFEGPVHPPPRAESPAAKPVSKPVQTPSTWALPIPEPSIAHPARPSPAPQSRLPRQESMFVKAKEEIPKPARPIPVVKSIRTPTPVLALENRLPVQGPERALSMENKAMKIAVKEVEALPAAAQPAPLPKFEPTDAPAFPMTAVAMQYFWGQMPQNMPPKAPSIDNAKPDELPEAKGDCAVPKPDMMVVDEEKPRPAVKKEREPTPERALPVRDLPKIPINAATLQYAKHFFQENPQALEPQRESTGNVEQVTPAPPRPKYALSPDARPFDPTGFNKENADPQTTFMKRMEKQGVSARKVTGVYASRYAK